MNKNLLITFLILIYSLSFAQLQWQESGVPVRQGENIDWSGTSVTTTDGNMVCIWSDTRNGDRGIFAQKMNPNGELLWEDEGIEINDAVDLQDFPVAIATENNDVIIAWWSTINWEIQELRVQKIDVNGNLQWGSEGLLLFSNESVSPDIHIFNDDSDGALIFWNTNSTELLGLHILNDGSIAPGWNINGNQIITQYHINLDIIADGYGGAVLAYRTGNYPDYDLDMQRVDGAGILLWGDNGTSLCNEDNIQDRVAISTNNDGIYYFFWRDHRNTAYNIYMQKVDQNGNKLWSEDLFIQGSIYVNQIKSVVGNDGYPIICWRNSEHIYAQKIDNDGNTLWEPNSLPIYLDEYCSSFDLQPDSINGCWITWDGGFYQNIDISIQHVNSGGTILLEENGMSICSGDYSRGLPIINTSSNNGLFVNWEDRRTGSACLYSQIVSFDGIIQLPENGVEISNGLSGNASKLKILSNEDNPFLIWKDSRENNSQIYLQSLNSDGSTIFVEDGMPITPLFSNDHNNFDANISSGSNKIAIVWEMSEVGYKQIYAQAIDFDGNYLWSNNYGLIIGQSSAQQETPQISSINNSGTYEYYIGWEDYTDFLDSRIMCQKIVNGNLEWGIEGKILVDRDGDDELTDIVENYYIWQSVGYNNENIFCLMVDENGDPAPG